MTTHGTDVVDGLRAPPAARRPMDRAIGGRQGSLDRHRFTVAVVTGLAVALVPFLVVLWDLWDGRPHVLRRAPNADFYDLQARAMFHGHLYVATGSLGVEGYVHDGHTYTYFGIFPSLLRMPILALTHGLDGRLTAPSMLLAWLVGALFCALLLWRVRILLRGSAALAWPEAVTYGLLAATMMGGSVLVFLASEAWVFHEDLIWSVALTVGSLFALLGVLERPTWGRVVASGLLVLGAMLNRLPTGYACVLGALLVAGWFAVGFGGEDRRRWWLALTVVGLVPLAAGCLINFAKFGVPFGLPLKDQVYTAVNAHRRAFLAANGGKGYSIRFLPSTLLAYLQPAGIRFTPVFPFITLPAAPAKVVGHVVLDRTTRTGSVPATMPLLFLLSCWGVVAAFRRRALGQVRLTRIVLVAGACGFVVALVWGWIADRYLADFLPFLIVASAVGLTDLWGRVTNTRRFARGALVGGVAVVAVFSLVANLAIASTPQATWTHTMVADYVQRQIDISNATGHPITENVMRGTRLPYWAPADKLFVVGDCAALYISSGENGSVVPTQQLAHRTWLPVELPAGVNHDYALTFQASPGQFTTPIPLLRFGSDLVVMQSAGGTRVRFDLRAPSHGVVGKSIPVHTGHRYRMVLVTDPVRDFISLTVGGRKAFQGVLTTAKPVVVVATGAVSAAGVPTFTFVQKRTRNLRSSICHSLISGHSS